MSADRFVESASALLVAALLTVGSAIGVSTLARAGDEGNPGAFQVAQSSEAEARKQKKAEERLQRQRQKAKQQERKRQKALEGQHQKTQQQDQKRQKTQQPDRKRQKAEERQRQKAQQQERQRQKAQQQERKRQKADQDERKRLKAEERQRQKAQQKQPKDQKVRQKDRKQEKVEDQPKQKKRLDKLRQKTKERDERKDLRQNAQDKKRLDRQERRIQKAQEKRKKTRRQEARRNEKQIKRLERRRSELRNELNPKKARSESRERRERRVERQRDWENKHARGERRRWRRDFGFHRRGRVIRRRNDRIIYAGLAAAAIAGALFIYYDDDVRFGWRARDVYVEPLANGWTRTVVIRPNGVRIITIRDSNGFIVRRYRVFPDNRVTFLYNNQPSWWDDEDLYVDIEPVSVDIPEDRYIVEPSSAPVETIYETVTAGPVDDLERTYTLNQVLVNARLRDYMPRIDLDAITFASGSAEIPVDQIDKLETIGVAMEQAIKDNNEEVYLLEGHTDATGSDEANLELSDRRAAKVADVLMEYFEIPPENLVTQGYGEQFLKIGTQRSEQRNRRVAIRRITPLLSKDKSQIVFDDKGNEIIEEDSGQQN